MTADQTPTPEDFERARAIVHRVALRWLEEPLSSFREHAGVALLILARLEAAERKVAAWGPILRNGQAAIDGDDRSESRMWRMIAELQPELKP